LQIIRDTLLNSIRDDCKPSFQESILDCLSWLGKNEKTNDNFDNFVLRLDIWIKRGFRTDILHIEDPKELLRATRVGAFTDGFLSEARKLRNSFGTSEYSEDRELNEHYNTIKKCWQEFEATYNVKVPSSSSTESSDAPDESLKKQSAFFEYEFVEFNAWVYSGSDNLWAGLIQKLYEAVESHFGPDFAYAQKRALYHNSILLGLIAFIATCAGGYFIYVLDTADHSDVEYIGKNIPGVLLTLAGIISGLKAVYDALYKSGDKDRKSVQIANRVESPNFKDKLGFMNDVKHDLDEIVNILENPSIRKGYWDFFLCGLFSWIKRFLRPGSPGLPCRLIILVDDLDRCPLEKIVEVLKSVVLLMEGSPIILFLAIDPR